jgi:chromosome partitioning protein
MIIGIVNQKGGTGKTTLAINLADALARRAQRVLLVDADAQQSVSNWYGVQKSARFSVHFIREDEMADVVQASTRSYDYTMIDGPPSLDGGTESIMTVSDLVVVPIGPSPLDIWSSKDIMALIRRTMAVREGLSARIVICKTIVGTRLSKDARSTLHGFGIELFHTRISQRVAYIEALIAGQSVIGYAPESAAAQEIQSLCDEVIQPVGRGPKTAGD